MTLVRRRRRLPLLLALAPFVRAGYYIDDTNTTLTYSSGPKAAWAPYAVGAETLELLLPNGTYQVIDAFVCYNHTYRYAACFDTDSCLLTVPFTGSGITVYVYQAGPVGINASITVDGANAQTNVLNAPPAPAYQVANVSMFDVQQLKSGPHTLKLLINDLLGSYSGMMFDYAYVNESFVAHTVATTTTTASSSTTSTSTAASTSLPASSSTSHTSIGGIVGGVAGVVALIVVAILAFLWVQRRRRRHTPRMVDLRSDNGSSPFTSHTPYDPPFTNTAGTYDPYAGHSLSTNIASRNDLGPSRSTDFGSSMPLVPNRLGSTDVQHTRAANGPIDDRDLVIPFTAAPSDSSGSRGKGGKDGTRLVTTNDTTNEPLSQPQPQRTHSASDSRQDTSPLLTDEQADFINSLHHNNVPAAAIARVVERMLADRHAGIREWERETRLARTNTMTTAPPSYDLVVEGGG